MNFANTRRELKFAITIFLFTFAFLLFPLGQVAAQTAVPLTAAPARQELLVNPDEESAVNVRFYNQGDSPVSGLLKVADFVVVDKEGTPSLIEDISQVSPRFSASAWISLPYDRITIAAKDKVSIQAKVVVPSDARPGGRYAAIYFEPGGAIPEPIGSPREAGTGVAIRIAALINLRVAGPINEGALLTQFLAPPFSQYGPVTITTEILNRGDYHIRPKGVITVTDFLGRLIDQSLLEEQNIFPDASRTYENSLGKKWMFGRFRASLQAAYGETEKPLTAGVYFWIFPFKETTVVVLSLVILALLMAGLGRRTKEKEKEIATELKEKEEELKKLKEELKKKESE